MMIYQGIAQGVKQKGTVLIFLKASKNAQTANDYEKMIEEKDDSLEK